MTEAEKAYQYFVIAVPENEEQAKAYFWARKALQPALTPPNEPLTIEQMREMDEPTPVWWEKASYWCLCERGFITAPNGNIYEFEETDGAFYRRPPEGGDADHG